MRAHSVLLLAAICCGCGEGLVEGNFPGDPLITVSGLVCGGAALNGVTSTKVGILWKLDGANGLMWTISAVEEISPEFPALFEMPVFDPPPDRTSRAFASDRGEITAGLGCPVVFDDRDLDGDYSGADQLLAISWDQLILFKHGDGAADGAPEGSQRFVEGERLQPGYQVVAGVCEAGHRSETLAPAEPDKQRVNVSMLDSHSEMPASTGRDRSCFSFF